MPWRLAFLIANVKVTKLTGTRITVNANNAANCGNNWLNPAPDSNAYRIPSRECVIGKNNAIFLSTGGNTVIGKYTPPKIPDAAPNIQVIGSPF